MSLVYSQACPKLKDLIMKAVQCFQHGDEGEHLDICPWQAGPNFPLRDLGSLPAVPSSSQAVESGDPAGFLLGDELPAGPSSSEDCMQIFDDILLEVPRFCQPLKKYVFSRSELSNTAFNNTSTKKTH